MEYTIYNITIPPHSIRDIRVSMPRRRYMMSVSNITISGTRMYSRKSSNSLSCGNTKNMPVKLSAISKVSKKNFMVFSPHAESLCSSDVAALSML